MATDPLNEGPAVDPEIAKTEAGQRMGEFVKQEEAKGKTQGDAERELDAAVQEHSSELLNGGLGGDEVVQQADADTGDTA